MHDARHGSKQPHPFDPAKAALLDDPARFAYLPPAELVKLLDLRHAATLLDFGAGTGTYAIEVARERPDVRLLALDESETMLAHLRRKIADSGVPSVTAIDPSELGALLGRVDRVLALNVLHELGDAPLAQLRALLAGGGKALFVDWNGDVERPHGPPRDHVYGVEEARRRLRDSGFVESNAVTFPYHHAFVVGTRDGVGRLPGD
jgi:SAM-dependent methyltransferase